MVLNFLEMVFVEVTSIGLEVKEFCFRFRFYYLLDRCVILFNFRCFSFLSIKMGIIIDLFLGVVIFIKGVNICILFRIIFGVSV